jgi:hypothetical protein
MNDHQSLYPLANNETKAIECCLKTHCNAFQQPQLKGIPVSMSIPLKVYGELLVGRQ